MKTKTETEYYNEDDFVQRYGQLHELTVTITLCEYRNLIRELERLDARCQQLEEEKRKLSESREALTSVLLKARPDLVDKIADISGVILDLVTKEDKANENAGNG